MPGTRPHNPTRAHMHEPIVIRSRSHTWCFRCQIGQEALLIAELARLARDPGEQFDWFDAACATRELTRRRAQAHTQISPSLMLDHPSPPHEMQS